MSLRVSPFATHVLVDVCSWHVFWPSNFELFLRPLAFLVVCPRQGKCQRAAAAAKGLLTWQWWPCISKHRSGPCSRPDLQPLIPVGKLPSQFSGL